MTRYVVYLPPAMTVSPRTGLATACSRDNLLVDSDSPDSSGRRPGVDADHVVGGDRIGEQRVGMLEHVVDVAAARRRVREVEIPVSVRRADDPVAAPRDDEQQALLGAGDDAGRAIDAVARDHDVDAFGSPHLELAAAADQVLDLVGPDAGRVDDLAGGDVELCTAFEIAHPNAGDPIAFSHEPDDARAVRDQRPVRSRSAGEHHRVPRVIDQALVEPNRAVDRVALP